MATPIVIEGKQVGRLRASWLLLKESWRFLSLDREMLWISPLTVLLNIFLLGIVVSVVFFVAVTSGAISDESWPRSAEYAVVFAVYVCGAFSLALGQAAIAHTVYTRVHGGNATFGQSLRTAFSRAGSLFVWSLITSTVGLVLHAIAERSKMLGQIVIALLGAAWGLVTYFVVPAMVIDKKTAFASIPRSATVFKQTWGQTLVSNFTLGAVFFVAHLVVLLSFVGLCIVAASYRNAPLLIVLCVLGVLWIILASIVHSTLNAVLRTLLYIYATENIVPTNFNPELLSSMLSRTGVVSQPPSAPSPGSFV